MTMKDLEGIKEYIIRIFAYPKYLHFHTSAVNGWMPKRVSENLIWNSTANLRGEAGCNIPLDLLNEFINNEFKSEYWCCCLSIVFLNVSITRTLIKLCRSEQASFDTEYSAVKHCQTH